LLVMPDLVLGAGVFGFMCTGVYVGTPVAVTLPRVGTTETRSVKYFSQWSNELRVLRRLRHPNIVILYGACVDMQHNQLELKLEMVNGVTLWILSAIIRQW